MHTVLIMYPCGIVVEGLLLAGSDEGLRLAVRGEADVLELCPSGHEWRTADGTAVTLGAVLCDAPKAATDVMPVRTLRAGSVV